MKFWILVIAFGVALVTGNPTGTNFEKSQQDDNEKAIPIKILSKCSFKDGTTGLISCAAEKSLKLFQQASNQESIELVPGVALVSDNPSSKRQAKSYSDTNLPSDPKQKIEKILDLIFDAANQLFSGRTLKFSIPEISTNGLARALEEGRGKMKKHMSPLLIGIGIKAILFKGLLLAGLGFLAIKAAILSKIAFALALVLASGSLFSGGISGLSGLKNIPFLGGHGGSGWSSGGGVGHGSYGPPGWSNGATGGWNQQYPYARSIDEKENEDSYSAQDLAYSEQKP